jgi:dihydropteroate synthase
MSDAWADPEGTETATGTSAPPFTVMGVINVTPDSFSDGGRFLAPEAAVAQGLRLEAEGAEILDIGGESTRPGAAPVSAEQEMDRVLPVIQGLVDCATSARLSVDTSKASVAKAALGAGATMVNDVSALRDPDMAGVVADAGADCCLMHMPGEPRTMQIDPRYDDVVMEVKAYLEGRLEFAASRGIAAERLLIDPGIGFGKTAEHNLELLARLQELVELGRPVVIGTSRKSFLGKLTGRPVEDRLPGTIASCLVAYEHGASVFRVHEVAPVHDALLVAAATVSRRWPTMNSAKATR